MSSNGDAARRRFRALHAGPPYSILVNNVQFGPGHTSLSRAFTRAKQVSRSRPDKIIRVVNAKGRTYYTLVAGVEQKPDS